ncbi:MAG: hypothetical protein M1324_04370 [Patescibacteria group bacterium]|nr:hypothetical protein [Patescibacteria group bacterium]
MMGMDSGMMAGGNGGALMFFGWLIYILFIVLIIFGIAALWKYLNK